MLFHHKISLKKRKLPGFTLIELLLYVGLLSILLFSTSAFLSILLESRVKNQTMAEVEQQGVQLMQILTQHIRNASAITVPALGASSSTLVLQVLAPNNPTVFDISSSTLRIQQGGGNTIYLTNDRITVSEISFLNSAQTGTSGAVRIQFVLTAFRSSVKQEYAYTQTFVGGATIRPN